MSNVLRGIPVGFHEVVKSKFQRIWNMRLPRRKKEEIWLSPMTKAPTPTEKSKKHRDNIKNAPKNFDYTTIADRLRTVSNLVTAVTQLVRLKCISVKY